MYKFVAIGRIVKTVQDHTAIHRLPATDPLSGAQTLLCFTVAQSADLNRKLSDILDAYAANPEGD
jgi:hypothetical protein